MWSLASVSFLINLFYIFTAAQLLMRNRQRPRGRPASPEPNRKRCRNRFPQSLPPATLAAQHQTPRRDFLLVNFDLQKTSEKSLRSKLSLFCYFASKYLLSGVFRILLDQVSVRAKFVENILKNNTDFSRPNCALRGWRLLLKSTG